jgi:hypothetical protein
MSTLPPIMGLSEIADYFGVSRQLARKWTATHDDFPAPYVELRMGKTWRTSEVLAYGKRRGRQQGAGPRPSGDWRATSSGN